MQSTWRGSGLVLVIDDDTAVLQVAKLILERFGFTVQTAQSGREGVDYYTGHIGQVRCVLLDMTMPDWNGEETFRRLRKADPNVKVILTSGYSESQATDDLDKTGLAGFLQKPYQVATLIEAVKGVLGP
jgi:CheY-like chemotaxis protein